MGWIQKCRRLCVVVGIVLINLLLFVYIKHDVSKSKYLAKRLPVRNNLQSPLDYDNTSTTRQNLDPRIQGNGWLNESKVTLVSEYRLNSTARGAKDSTVNKLPVLQHNTTIDSSWASQNNDVVKETNKRRLPDVILIGAKKCGTNALKFYLRLHPHVCVTQDEVHYYDNYDQRNLSWYKSKLCVPHKNKSLVFEKTPKYFVTKSAPRNMLRELPKGIKFILLVRDPVVRLLSDFRFTTIWDTNHLWRREQSVASETSRLLSEIVTKDLSSINGSSPFIYTGDYAKHFNEWLKYFDRSKFLIIDNDEMKKDIPGTLRSVESFLGLAHMSTNLLAADGLGIKIGTEIVQSVRTDDKDLPRPVLSETFYQILRDYYHPRNKEFERLSGMTFAWTRL